jgi:polyhydroxybutyrate depolymerase
VNSERSWVPASARTTSFSALALLLAALSAGAAALAPGDHEIALIHGELQRSYIVHVPPQAASGKPLPAVLNFHGGAAHAREQKRYSRMDETADREGFIAVYPNGSSGIGGRLLTWNAGACCGWAAAGGVDDVGFTIALLDDLARRVALDAGRIYATGLSNGSMMAYRVAAEVPQRIAAVAGVAGAMTLSRFAPALPVPVMHIHSVDDQRALYDGGLGPVFPFTNSRVMHESVDAMLKKWTAHNGCLERPQVGETVRGRAGAADAAHTATLYGYFPCRGGTEVLLWKLTGAGHVWPGGLQDYLTWLLGPGTTVIDANDEMWRFFSRFRRK